MKEYHGPSLKRFKATYTGAATALNNKSAATRNVKKHYDKVVDMLKAINAVGLKNEIIISMYKNNLILEA